MVPLSGISARGELPSTGILQGKKRGNGGGIGPSNSYQGKRIRRLQGVTSVGGVRHVETMETVTSVGVVRGHARERKKKANRLGVFSTSVNAGSTLTGGLGGGRMIKEKGRHKLFVRGVGKTLR